MRLWYASDVPPRARFSRDTVLEAAIEVARIDGLLAVSARSVAKRLGSSTAPVTSYFDSMQALNDAVVERTVELLLETVAGEQGPDPLLAASLGFLRFVTHEPRLYAGLFLVPHETPPDWVALRRAFAHGLKDSERYRGLSTKARDAVAWRASVVTHGICIEIWSGRWTKTGPDALARLVDELVAPVVAGFFERR
ncbi:MAG: TetR/AcrR family transcriptional regulator [Sandaracinaceae bacterium]